MEEGDINIYTSVACDSWVEIKYRPIRFIPLYRSLKVIDIVKSFNLLHYLLNNTDIIAKTEYKLIEVNKMEYGNYRIKENSVIIMDGVKYIINEKTFPFILNNFKNLKTLKTLN